MAVEEGEGNPREEPHVQLGVEATRLDDARRASCPHVPVGDDSHAEVGGDYGEVTPPMCKTRPLVLLPGLVFPADEAGVTSRVGQHVRHDTGRPQ